MSRDTHCVPKGTRLQRNHMGCAWQQWDLVWGCPACSESLDDGRPHAASNDKVRHDASHWLVAASSANDVWAHCLLVCPEKVHRQALALCRAAVGGGVAGRRWRPGGRSRAGAPPAAVRRLVVEAVATKPCCAKAQQPQQQHRCCCSGIQRFALSFLPDNDCQEIPLSSGAQGWQKAMSKNVVREPEECK